MVACSWLHGWFVAPRNSFIVDVLVTISMEPAKNVFEFWDALSSHSLELRWLSLDSLAPYWDSSMHTG